MNDPYEVLTVDQVAAVLRMHPKSVHRLFRSGRLAGMKKWRKWITTRGHLNRFIEASWTMPAVVARPEEH